MFKLNRTTGVLFALATLIGVSITSAATAKRTWPSAKPSSKASAAGSPSACNKVAPEMTSEIAAALL